MSGQVFLRIGFEWWQANRSNPMRVAILTTDNRENDRRYDLTAPYFGTAPTGLLSGFAMLADEELRVSSNELRVDQSKIQNPESIIAPPPFSSSHAHRLPRFR